MIKDFRPIPKTVNHAISTILRRSLCRAINNSEYTLRAPTDRYKMLNNLELGNGNGYTVPLFVVCNDLTMIL